MPKILVVDDETAVLNALRRLLRRSGFEVETAGSGAEALARLEAFTPDVVLSDFRMPGMNGAELLAQVRQRLPLALRLIISGYADLDSVMTSVNDGEICRFISKPWDDERLAPMLQSLLENRTLVAALHQSFARAPQLSTTDVLQHEKTVEVRLHRVEPFSAAKALDVVRKFVGVLEAERLAIVSGLLERHGGKVTFVAEIGGEERLSLELPVVEAKTTPKALDT